MPAPSGLVVRPAGAGDLLGVLAVHAHRDPGGPQRERATALEERAWDETIGRDGLTVYLAILDDEPVGTASLILVPTLTWLCAPTAFVEAVVVDHRYRRRGIASAVMDRLLDDARAAGCNKVQLLSHKRHADDGAHALYERLGFAPEAEGFRRYLIEHPRPSGG